MKYRIVLVPFPYDDFSATKLRPAICLTDKIGQYEHIVVAFITSQIHKSKIKTDILINQSEETGLKVDSAILLHRLISVPIEKIKRNLGKLPEEMEEELNQKLLKLFRLK